MTGWVDANGRSWLSITVQNPWTGASQQFDVCVDPAFEGELALPLAQIQGLELRGSMNIITAVLADGSQVKLDAYTCLVPWFGVLRQIECLAKVSLLPLLGIGLLQSHILTIDYPALTVTLT